MKGFVKRIYGFMMIEIILFITIMILATSLFSKLYKQSITTHNDNMIEMHLCHIINDSSPGNMQAFKTYCKTNNIDVKTITKNMEYEVMIKGKTYTIFFNDSSKTYCYKRKN